VTEGSKILNRLKNQRKATQLITSGFAFILEFTWL